MEFVHSDSSSLYPFFHFSPFSSLFALSFPIRSVCPPQTTLGFLDRQINRQVDIALRSTPFFPSLLPPLVPIVIRRGREGHCFKAVFHTSNLNGLRGHLVSRFRHAKSQLRCTDYWPPVFRVEILNDIRGGMEGG